jgi:hypothetical protein
LLRGSVASSDAIDEGRALARIRHPGVVTVFGTDRIDGRTGLWMELVEGRTLEELVRESGPWDARAAALAGVDLLAALAAVHAASLLHRDVKAQNVMREAGGRIVLMDFGVGRGVGALGPPAGTPLYMAPELLLGGRATPQSDIYSVGVLLYHLVTGGHPVTAGDVEGLRRAHAAGEVRRLRDARPALPDPFVRVVERALQPAPERRFATAGEMEQALLESVLPPERREGASPAPRRGFAPPALAGLLGAALLLGWLTWRRDPGAPQPTIAPSATPAPAAQATPRERLTRASGIDPFVRPLGAGDAGGDAATPAADAPYTIEASVEKEHLRVRSSAALNLYVFAIDETDRPLLVHPIPGRSSENPLVPGQETRLWIGAVPELERRVAVATPLRLAALESEAARQRVPLASWRGALPLTEPALAQLGRALGFEPAATGRFLGGAAPLAGHVEMLRGAWVRRLAK